MIPLGSIFGIPLRLHWSFPLLLAYVVYLGVQNGLPPADIALNAGFVLAIFGCVVLHECGHAFAARRYGIASKHITLLPLGGVVQLTRDAPTPIAEIVIALAGPAVNVGIAAGIAAVLFVRDGLLAMPEVAPLTGGFAEQLMVANVALLIFNLIPAFPLDGGRVLRGLLWLRLSKATATRAAARTGQALAIAMGLFALATGQLFMALIAVFILLSATAVHRSATRPFT